jgi:cytochrome c553
MRPPRSLTGKAMYEKECAECHMKNGEGDKAKFYPVLAGQHYKYLLRQMTEIREGQTPQRQPGHGQDHQEIRRHAQLVAISAYQASMTMPGAMCKGKSTAKKKG